MTGRKSGCPEPTSPPNPVAARVLRVELEELRNRGEDFASAWDTAIPVALDAASKATRASWAGVFRSTQAAWEAAYRRQGPAGALGGLFVANDADGQRPDGHLVC